MYSNNMLQKAIEKMLAENGAIKLDRQQAPYLHLTVDELSKKAGISSPDIYLVDSIKGKGNISKIGGFAIGKNSVVISRGMLKVYDNEDLQKPTDPKLSAVIGHELYHNKGFNAQILGRTLPVLIMPIIATIACYFLNKTASQTNNPKTHNLDKNVSQFKHSLGSDGTEIQPWFEKAITWGKYLASAIMGFVVGKTIFSQVSKHHEYKADAFSKELHNGDGKPLAEALTLLSAKAKKIIKEEGYGLPQWKVAMNKIFPSHPKTEKRIAAMLA